MQLYIDGKLAAIKKGVAFEYVSENRLFTDADDYSLDITLPIKGCPQNYEIFGRVFRKDVAPGKLIFEGEIRDGLFHKTGAVAVTEINEAELKVQFLAGRSAQNFYTTLENVYINELELGAPNINDPSFISPAMAMNPERSDFESVCLPWVNGSGEAAIIHNSMEKDTSASGNVYKWSRDVSWLTWMPYLLHIAKRICAAIGFSYDFSLWEADESKKYFLICNVLPDAWEVQGYARALPQWSVDEFFSKLEDFLGCQFDIDFTEKSIVYKSFNSIIGSLPEVGVNDVVEEFTSDVELEDSKCGYMDKRNFLYKSQSSEMWPFYSCKWYIDLVRGGNQPFFNKVHEYDTMAELIADTRRFANWNGFSGRGSIVHDLFYVRQFDMYFILRWHERDRVGTGGVGQAYWLFNCFLQPVNSFGELINTEPRTGEDSEGSVKKVELEFVPVDIDYTERMKGFCAFLYPSSYAERSGVSEDQFLESSDPYREDFTPQIGSESFIKSGEEKGKAEYYNNIFIGFWDGRTTAFPFPNGNGLFLPRPYVENVNIDTSWNYTVSNFSMRLNDGSVNSRFYGIDIDVERKYNFKFISEAIPDAKSIFVIQGKRYLCESLTFSFNDSGRSKLIKGVFWAVKE